ncbi:hypothetical protein VM1G_07542 [Cytospora mali]|uniref:Major facilitator superfamily (MFS) profile domain-containing protein n=1 Tax=Cytospora mali TaxID=578113 RepID=A0A194W6J5_CYTMA|nr:hypothetical protein VM1G_07542 [Valsa mali]
MSASQERSLQSTQSQEDKHALHVNEQQGKPHSDHDVTLIPRPSDNPRDPLNWSRQKKYTTVAVLSLSTFAGFTTSLAGQLEVGPLSKLYGKPTTTLAYQNSAALAGMIIGSIFFFWLSRLIGRQSVMLWSLLGCLLSSLFASLLTDEHDFDLLVISRGLAGFFGTVVGVLGPRCLIDMFFLHQRGRAFTIFHFFFDLGNTAGPSISALVTHPTGDWRWAFRWCIILDGVAFLVYFALMDDTTWDRTPGAVNLERPSGWLASRIATFVPGTQITRRVSFREFIKQALAPFEIAMTPVSMVLSFFTLFSFGFYVAMNATTPTYLQKPIKEGGYGFTPFENALFQFFHWVGIGLALPYGQIVSDRIPLYFASRHGHGSWKPEYRLHALWLPALICNPIGIAIFGYGLAHHMSWGFLGFAQILVTYGSLCITPITVNYLSECFTHNIEETAIVLNSFRIGFGLSIAFYLKPWVGKVGLVWTYGTMAFIQLFAFFFVVILLWKGHEIRRVDPFGMICTEEGQHIVDEKDTHDEMAESA